jgi:hypothetical protein
VGVRLWKVSAKSQKKQHPLQVWWYLEKQRLTPFCRFCYISNMKKLISFLIFFLIFQSCSNKVEDKTKSKNELDYISISKTGNLVYHEDEKGYKIPDFSYVGYHSGGKTHS